MKNNKRIKTVLKILFSIILLIVVGYVYFSFPLMIMPDSTEYYGYLKIFYGEQSFSNWNIVRGPTFPTILYIITLVFGNSQFGILIGTFIAYVIVIITGFIVLKKINFRNKASKLIAYLLFIICVVFNFILVGYMHSLLTEFVTIPLLVIFSILCLKWIKTTNKYLKVLLPILLIISCVSVWFLKQPYVFIALGSIIVSSLISIFEEKKVKNAIYRIITILSCVISIIICNMLWNYILLNNNVDMNTGRDTDSFIKTAIINGNTSFSIDFYKEHYTEEYINNTNLINDKNKKEILKILAGKSQYKSFKLVNVFKNFESREENNIEKKLVLYSCNDEYTTGDAIKMYCNLLIEYPTKTIESYTLNYLAIANVVPSIRHKDANEYYPSLCDGFYFENKTIGYSIYNTDNNMLWLNEEHYLYNNVKNLKTNNNSNIKLKEFANKCFEFYNSIYSIITILIPVILIGLILKRKKTNRISCESILNLGIILIGASFIHLLFHAFTGAIIDRYGFVVFPGAFLGTLILLFNSKEDDKKMKEKYVSNSAKTLVIIPAYNESQNIEKVIGELKKDFTGTDILVINDSSTDNTKEIVIENNINCITTVFNLNYAYAVQTGIKYAKKYNYDYCLMFDGDGQHIAKEAKKLLERIERTNCDIVIGSRYLEKGNYKAPKFRKIGTSFFTWLIKVSCHTKISDPLSGFQVINKRVIDKYSKMGGYPEFPDANLIIEMLLDGYTIEEVSVKMRNREFGESMHGGIIKPIKYMIVMLYTIIILILNKVFGRRK